MEIRDDADVYNAHSVYGGGSPEEVLLGWNVDKLGYPTFRMTLLAKIMDRMTIRYLSKSGDLTYAEWRVLARLAMMPDGGTVRQVAELAWVDRAEVSRAANALEVRNLVVRKKNERDRRAPLLLLTKKGVDQYEFALKQRIEFHENLLSNLSNSERDTLDSLLYKIAENVSNIMKTENLS
ncbi:MarR family winged helix-turn-helix transcriptional regulator [Novosphingobium sp. CF614]|uniref:MarR family winged helix-turn-helix transcriptional regulator n=1 Tax=Novosphingobium sp. CF614 TaxID=1884364 RepID=UPI000B84F5ED|nr:MarR family winged helix-turn-helix transcriptional regulator [Novosphingobium sp. CF614]